jgi:hypothetical protein
MGPVGSSLASGEPSRRREPPGPRRRGWFLAIVVALLALMCGMIAWSQWYAIHVNVPKYRAHHTSAVR